MERDGRIVVGGMASVPSIGRRTISLVVRLRENGTLDRTFSRDGVRSVNFAGQRYDDVHGLDLQPDGRIVAAGISAVGYLREDPRIAVLRLNRNGTLDRRFGKRLLKPGAHGGYARAVLSTVAESSLAGWLTTTRRSTRQPGPSSAIAPSGALDRSFGKGGIVLSDFGTGADWVGALATQRDGKIVAAGEVYRDQAVARYLPR